MKKYIQLYNQLRELITGGALSSGSRFPTESAIAAEHGLSRQTVRQALEMLRRDGFIYSIQGSGSFVGSSAARVPESRHIAVITTYYSDYIFPSILRGIGETAAEKGYTVEISTTNNSIAMEKTILTNILQHPVQGIIVEGTKTALPNPNMAYYQQLAKQGIPIVFINGIYPSLEGERIVSVVTDDFKGGYWLAKLLIQKGHRSIGCIFKSDDAQGINRFAGFIAALADFGVEYNDTHFIWFATETKQSFLPFLRSNGLFMDCSAIVCYNDEIAKMVAAHLREIPHNIRSIASFDGELNAGQIPRDIEFRSLPHPKDDLGRTAALKLFDMLVDRPTESAVLAWAGVE